MLKYYQILLGSQLAHGFYLLLFSNAEIRFCTGHFVMIADTNQSRSSVQSPSLSPFYESIPWAPACPTSPEPFSLRISVYRRVMLAPLAPQPRPIGGFR